MPLRISLLGPLRVEVDGRPLPERAWRSRQERRLLAALVLARGATVPAARLAEMLWAGADHDAAALTLRSAVSSLRRTLEPGGGRASRRYVETRPGGYAWGRGGAWVDLEEFLACVDPPSGAPGEEALARAVALYHGPLLQDEPDAGWAMAEREHVRGRFLRAAEELAALRLAAGAYRQAAAAARRGLEADPLREPLWRALMRAEALAGDVAAALQGFERFRLALDHELGAAPSAQTRELHAAILRGEVLPGGRDSPRPAARVARLAGPGPSEPGPPLVGRAAELAQLRAWVAALWQREGGVVALVGEAGAGKTRLLAELAREAEARGAQPIVLRGSPIERGLPFATLAEALRPLARSAPDALLRRLPRAALAQLAELIPAMRERAPGLPTLPPLPPDEGRSRLIDGVVDLALALAALAPLVVCCDDAQWADEALLAALGRLARHAPRRPLLVVLAYRPEELPESPALHTLLRALGREMLLRPLLLGPLGEDDAAELVAGPAARRPPHVDALARRLARHADGSPLLLSVAAQALLDAHAARSLADLAPDVARAAPLPDLSGAAAVRDIVEARRSRLPEPARDLLDALAVVGRPASLDLVELLGGADALERAQELVDRRFLAEEGGGRLAFAHEAARATVAALLGAPRRRLLHRRVAQALIALLPGEPAPPAEVAAHLLAAGRGFEAELLRFAAAAGDEAALVRADGAARSWYAAALAAAERLGPEADPELAARARAGLARLGG